jgi:hypothetical protein
MLMTLKLHLTVTLSALTIRLAGAENKGFGYIRYATAADLFADKYKKDKISFDFVIRDVPRCLTHSYTKQDLTRNLPSSEKDTAYVLFRDFIPRYYSSSAVVIQGIKENESTALTTMWSVLGFPLTSVAIPVWLLEDGSLPAILTEDASGNAPLSTLALKLKDKVFSTQNDARENYLNVAALINKKESGIRQRLDAVEDEILKRADKKLSVWRSSTINETEAKEFYNWLDKNVIKDITERLE